tara:strand:+ start:501 stop:1106 length:606 start_codon:yes stop_codon:yes gene_type:complete
MTIRTYNGDDWNDIFILNEARMTGDWSDRFVGKDGRRYEITIIEERKEKRHDTVRKQEYDPAYYEPIEAIIWFEGKIVGRILIQEKWYCSGTLAGHGHIYDLGCECEHAEVGRQISLRPIGFFETGNIGCGCIHGEINDEHRRNGIGTFVIEQFKRAGYAPCPDESCGLPYGYGEGWIEFWKNRGLKEINNTPIEQLVPSY